MKSRLSSFRTPLLWWVETLTTAYTMTDDLADYFMYLIIPCCLLEINLFIIRNEPRVQMII